MSLMEKETGLKSDPLGWSRLLFVPSDPPELHYPAGKAGERPSTAYQTILDSQNKIKSL